MDHVDQFRSYQTVGFSSFLRVVGRVSAANVSTSDAGSVSSPTRSAHGSFIPSLCRTHHMVFSSY